MLTFIQKHPKIKNAARGILRYKAGIKYLILGFTGHIPSHIIR